MMHLRVVRKSIPVGAEWYHFTEGRTMTLHSHIEDPPRRSSCSQHGGLERMRQTFSRSAGILMSVLLTTALASAPVTATALRVTPQIRAKQAEAVAASTRLQSLNDDLEMKREDLLAVTDQLEQTRIQIASTEETLVATQLRLDASEDLLSQRAEAIYRSGPVGIADVLLGTRDFQDFLSRVDALDRISASDADLVIRIRSQRDEVTRVQVALENREGEQVALRTDATAKQAVVEAAVRQQSSYVASLNSQVKTLMKQEAAREAAAAAALARSARRTAGASSRSTDLGSLGEPHPEVVQIASHYLGVPYVWGGSSPSGFDCSGLAQYCYAKAGISIPRTSREQFRIGHYIPPGRTDLLGAGDLVFFGYGADASRIHHVGIYAGNGTFIEAPYTGEVVRYARLSSRGDYVGAVRP